MIDNTYIQLLFLPLLAGGGKKSEQTSLPDFWRGVILRVWNLESRIRNQKSNFIYNNDPPSLYSGETRIVTPTKNARAFFCSPASSGAMISLAITLIFLSLAFPAHAEDRFGCEVRKQKVINQIQESNMCHEDSDCSYVEVKSCNKGCSSFPIYKHMEQRLELALRDYHATCTGNCAVECKKFLQAKCVRGRCHAEFRDWKYLKKQK